MREHILWETINEQKGKIADLEKENLLLGERCNQLLKDLTDRIDDIKANCDLAIEGRDIKIKELEQQIEQMQDAKCTSCTYLGGLQLKITELEKQIEKMKCCQICAYGGNDFGVCYSNKPCKKKKKKSMEVSKKNG